MSKTLKLTLKKKWFDLLKSGEKIEEYREVKKHWIKQLVTNRFTAKDYKNENEIIGLILQNKEHYIKNRTTHFDFVEFRNGYSKTSPQITMECKEIEIGNGKVEWGAIEGEQYFIIKLGREVGRQNC